MSQWAKTKASSQRGMRKTRGSRPLREGLQVASSPWFLFQSHARPFFLERVSAVLVTHT